MGKAIKKTKTKANKINGLFFYVSASIFALTLLIAILGGILYAVVKSNAYGVSDRYRSHLSSIPVIKNALPQAIDGNNEIEYLSNDEVRMKYREILTLYDKLLLEKNDLEYTVAEIEDMLKHYRSIESDLELEKEMLSEERQQLSEDNLKINELLALSDKTGYQEFYQRLDADAAGEIYEKVVQAQKQEDDKKDLSKYYENMEPKSAAAIFEDWGTSGIETIVTILMNMNNEKAAGILQEINPQMASRISNILAERYLNEGR